jgi:hypothetical protein
MRLALATALLAVCLFGQGCLSFMFFGKSPDRYSARRKTLSGVFGAISGPLIVTGLALIADGKAQMDKYHHRPEKWEYTQGRWTAIGGGLLQLPAAAMGILSMVFGYQHYRGRTLYGTRGSYDDYSAPWRRGYSERREKPGRNVPVLVGAPARTASPLDLGRIGQRRLPIQRACWYLAREE